MDQNDKQAIQGLFGKLADVERQNPGRDAQADAFIAQEISRQPGAPYYMAQTIVVQEHALNAAQDRISQLEADVETARQSQQGGFLSRLFGGGSPTPPQRRPAPAAARPQPYAPQPAQGGGGGGFLAGAAQTAMGVAGGVLLANAIGGMLGGDEAQAAEPAPAPEPEEEPVREEAESFDEGGFDDGGGFDDE